MKIYSKLAMCILLSCCTTLASANSSCGGYNGKNVQNGSGSCTLSLCKYNFPTCGACQCQCQDSSGNNIGSLCWPQ